MRTDQGNFKASCLLLRNGSTDIAGNRISCELREEHLLSPSLDAAVAPGPGPSHCTNRTDHLMWYGSNHHAMTR